VNKRTVVFALLGLLSMTTAASTQSGPTGKDIEIRLEKPVVITASRRNVSDLDGNLLRNYLLWHSVVPADDVDHRLPAARFCNLERYELSSAELALQGLGMGTSMGLCAGALGSSFGLWDDDKSLLMMGALSALGVVWTTTKADDSSWGCRYRLGD
jgi:hypothetical protein